MSISREPALHRWVPTLELLLFSDAKCQFAIHRECSDGCFPGWSESGQTYSFPLEVFIPHLGARIKKCSYFTGDRIVVVQARSLAERTGNAGKRQVFRNSFTARRDRMCVIDVKGGFLSRLREAAILAVVAGSPANESPKLRRNPTHGKRRSARSRKRLSNSARLTSPSASLFSSAVKGVPSSCLSRRNCSLRCTPSGRWSEGKSPGSSIWTLTAFAICSTNQTEQKSYLRLELQDCTERKRLNQPL